MNGCLSISWEQSGGTAALRGKWRDAVRPGSREGPGGDGVRLGKPGVTASAEGRCLADADLFPREIAGSLIVARAELDRHVNDRGRCPACKTPFPCQRACLAEQTLGWF